MERRVKDKMRETALEHRQQVLQQRLKEAGGCIGFGKIKGPLVLAKEKGDIVGTRREMKFKTIPPTVASQWELVPAESEPERGFFLFENAEGYKCGEPSFYNARPRYRPGKVYRVGVPSFRTKMKLLCLRAEPQKLSQMSEKDAVEELVQGAGINADGGPWWDYLALEFCCPTALASYRTMLAAEIGRDVWDEGLWFWAYRFEMVERPMDNQGPADEE